MKKMSPGMLLVVVTLVLSISLVESRPSYSYHYQTPGGGHVRVNREQVGVRKAEGTNRQIQTDIKQGCETTGYKKRIRELCEEVIERICKPVKEVEYRKEIQTRCDTRIQPKCNTTIRERPREVCKERTKTQCSCQEVPDIQCHLELEEYEEPICENVLVEECEDVYKEIPFLVDDEACEDVPRLECTVVEDEVPIQVCPNIKIGPTYTKRRTPSPDSLKANEAALDKYRLGWATGDTDIIISLVTDTFNFTWVPEDDVLSKDRFPSFFGDFKANAEADGRAKYFMRFANIIHRQIGDTLYEAADWIVDDFDRGSYFNAARDGKVIWDMATT